jgi:hypothetical protein
MMTVGVQMLLTMATLTQAQDFVGKENASNALRSQQFLSNRSVSSENDSIDLKYMHLDGVSPSPKCWKSAITLFRSTNDPDNFRDVSALCAAMPEAYQKRLALEISQCHLNDLGKFLYRNDGFHDDCGAIPFHATDVDIMLSVCLKQMTPAGESTYTTYVTYVQNLCIRLTQEVFIEYQRQAQREIVANYAEISLQSVQQWNAIRDVADKHAQEMEELALIPARITNHLSSELTNLVKKTIQSELQEGMNIQLNEYVSSSLRNLLQMQLHEQEKILTRLVDSVEYRDEANKQRFDDWTEHTVSMWQKQEHLMNQQQQRFKDHRRQIEALSATVTSTSQKMQPLLGLQELIQLATSGYTWITFLLFFVCTFNIIWLITSLGRCYSIRPHLYGIVLLEALLELSASGAVQYDVISESERVQYITEVRRWAIFLECLVFVSGCIISLFKNNSSASARDQAVNYTRKEPNEYIREHAEHVDSICKQPFYEDVHNFQAPCKNKYSSDIVTRSIRDHQQNSRPVIMYRQVVDNTLDPQRIQVPWISQQLRHPQQLISPRAKSHAKYEALLSRHKETSSLLSAYEAQGIVSPIRTPETINTDIFYDPIIEEDPNGEDEDSISPLEQIISVDTPRKRRRNQDDSHNGDRKRYKHT